MQNVRNNPILNLFDNQAINDVNAKIADIHKEIVDWESRIGYLAQRSKIFRDEVGENEEYIEMYKKEIEICKKEVVRLESIRNATESIYGKFSVKPPRTYTNTRETK